MVRKITLLFLLFIGLHSVADAQVRDSVFISLPYGMDTTCDSTQLMFTATESSDTFTGVQYHWYTDNVFTGVVIDTFLTTALVTGDSVYCDIVFTNSFGALDSFKSNTIIIYRSSSFPPRVWISLTVGSNPDCEGHPLTFTAYPVNGGSSPSFQWLIDDTVIAGEDSITMTRYFDNGDVIKCQMVSNSACAFPYPLTDTSDSIVVSHDSVTATVGIDVTRNPICAGTLDTFNAAYTNAGTGATIAWYVDSVLVPTALGLNYYTNTLHNGNYVYAILNAPDPCVINHTTVSNVITMTVVSLADDTVWDEITAGVNPGCLDSAVTLTGRFGRFGTAPDINWYVNGVLVPSVAGDTQFTAYFSNDDLVTFVVNETDNGCYMSDTLSTHGILMVRDSTPVTPWLSLIGDQLVVNNAGGYTWYFDSVDSYDSASIVPGVTGQTYNPHTPGYYYVVKDSANCPSLPSNIIYITLLGVPNISAATIRVYPNPTSGIINIDWGSNVADETKMDVFNMVGQGMYHEDIRGSSGHQTDLSFLPEGDYMLVLRDGSGSKATYKISIVK